MAESPQAVMEGIAEASVSTQQEMVALETAFRTLVEKRTPYVLAVQAVLPEHKDLMQQALVDFDQHAVTTIQEHKHKVKAALQHLIEHTTDLMKFFE